MTTGSRLKGIPHRRLYWIYFYAIHNNEFQFDNKFLGGRIHPQMYKIGKSIGLIVQTSFWLFQQIWFMFLCIGWFVGSLLFIKIKNEKKKIEKRFHAFHLWRRLHKSIIEQNFQMSNCRCNRFQLLPNYTGNEKRKKKKISNSFLINLQNEKVNYTNKNRY